MTVVWGVPRDIGFKLNPEDEHVLGKLEEELIFLD